MRTWVDILTIADMLKRAFVLFGDFEEGFSNLPNAINFPKMHEP